jgi:hypothetical protein
MANSNFVGAASTVTTAACSIPELWSKKVAKAVHFKCQIANRVNREYEGELSSMGDTLHVVMQSNYTANTKSANTDVTFESLTNTATSLVVDTHKYTAVMIEDIVKKQAQPGFQDRQSANLAYPLSRAMDTSLSAIFDGFADNGTVGTAGVELSESDYMTAWQKLAEAGAVEEGMVNADVSWFLSAAAWVAALKIEHLINKDYGAIGELKTASLGMILGAPTFMSNLLESDATGQHDCAVFHKDVLALAAQETPRVDSQYFLQSLGTAFVADVIYGVKEIQRPFEAAANVTGSDNFGVYLATV